MWPLFKLELTAVHHMAFPEHAFISCNELLPDLSVLPQSSRECVNMILQVSPHEKSIRVTTGDRQDNAISPPCPLHLPGYATSK
jgi:hypothetical protein